MSYAKYLDEQMLLAVINSPTACRMFLEALQKRGLKIDHPLDSFTDDERRTIATKVIEELRLREGVPN